jgi:hypothetical protein
VRTPDEAVLFEQPQIASNCFGGDVEFRGELRDIDLAVPAGQRDYLVVPLVRIQPAPPPRPNRGLFVTPEKRVARITIQASSLHPCPVARPFLAAQFGG